MAGFLIMMLIVFGLPVVLGLLVRSHSSAGAQLRKKLGISESRMAETASFSRWWHADRDRKAAALQIASRHNLRYVGSSTDEMQRLERFFLFRTFRGGTMEEMVLGERDGFREALFTHGKMRWRYTFAHFSSARLDLPAFHLAARDYPVRDQVSPEIVFEGFAHQVYGEDEPRIRALLDGPVRARLAAHAGFWIEGDKSEFLCGRDVDYTQTDEREAFFKTARGICAMFER